MVRHLQVFVFGEDFCGRGAKIQLRTGLLSKDSFGGQGLAVLQTVGNQTQCQRLDGRRRLLLGAAVRGHAGERRDIGQPPPILFAVVLDG